MHHTNFLSSQLGRILMNSRLYHLVVSGFNTDISNHQTRCQGENSRNCFEVKFCNNLQIFCQPYRTLDSLELCLSSRPGLSALSQLVKVCLSWPCPVLASHQWRRALPWLGTEHIHMKIYFTPWSLSWACTHQGSDHLHTPELSQQSPMVTIIIMPHTHLDCERKVQIKLAQN